MDKKDHGVIVILGLIVLVVLVSGCTNPSSNTFKHYEGGQVSFDYPSDWNLQNNSTEFDVEFITSDYYCSFKTIMLNSTENYKSYSEHDGIRLASLDTTNVDGHSGLVYTYGSKQGSNYLAYIDGGNKVYKLQLIQYNTPTDTFLNETEGYKIFNKILNSTKIAG